MAVYEHANQTLQRCEPLEDAAAAPERATAQPQEHGGQWDREMQRFNITRCKTMEDRSNWAFDQSLGFKYSAVTGFQDVLVCKKVLHQKEKKAD